MAIGVGRTHGAAIAEINVTPMADVMIVLLIIFMVATPAVLTLQDLDERLRTALESRREPTLLVLAADDVSCARLVAAVDVAKGAGAVRIGLVER